jgi:hypothetical protein
MPLLVLPLLLPLPLLLLLQLLLLLLLPLLLLLLLLLPPLLPLPMPLPPLLLLLQPPLHPAPPPYTEAPLAPSGLYLLQRAMTMSMFPLSSDLRLAACFFFPSEIFFLSFSCSRGERGGVSEERAKRSEGGGEGGGAGGQTVRSFVLASFCFVCLICFSTSFFSTLAALRSVTWMLVLAPWKASTI